MIFLRSQFVSCTNYGQGKTLRKQTHTDTWLRKFAHKSLFVGKIWRICGIAIFKRSVSWQVGILIEKLRRCNFCWLIHKHRENRKKLHRERLIGCRGVKLSLLLRLLLLLSLLSLLLLSQFDFWVLSQFNFFYCCHNLISKFLSQFDFLSCHNLIFWVLSVWFFFCVL